MAIDIREISLTEEQECRIAELAEQFGSPWARGVGRDVISVVAN